MRRQKCGLIMMSVVGSVLSWAQSFDVASVKVCDSNAARGTNAGDLSPGRVTYNCQNLMSYIRSAYGAWGKGSGRPTMGPFNIVGGPAWINGDLYRIQAEAEGSPSMGMTAGPMMQALLEDRFKLKIHRETREVPVYALVVTKAGLKLPAAKVECFALDVDRPPSRAKQGQPPPPSCGFGKRTRDGIEIHGTTMAEFCAALANTPLRMERRKFIDRTGVARRFDFDLKFPAEVTAEEGAARPPIDDLDRLQDALSRVGLQLKSEKGQDEFIVIDHAERPSAN